MTESRHDLIKGLVADLQPVNRPGNITRPFAWWLASALIYGCAIVLATGGWRAGAFEAFRSSPAIGLEVLIAITAIVLLAHAAFRSAIPDALPRWRRFALPLALVGAWVLFYVIGLSYPAIPPSMLGKREHCFLQTLLFSLPSFAVLLWLVRGLMPLWPRTTAAAAGGAAAAIPAILMQLACMYDPLHALLYHLTPVFMVAALGALAGPVVLTRREISRRPSATAVH
jgi:hypothetical protein